MLIEAYKPLMGAVTLESIKLAVNVCKNGAEIEPEVGLLSAFDHTLRSSFFYGLQSDWDFTERAIVGRYQIVKMGGEDILLLCALEDEEADAFARIMGISGTEMCLIYDKKVNSNPRATLPDPLVLAKARRVEVIPTVELVQ